MGLVPTLTAQQLERDKWQFGYGLSLEFVPVRLAETNVSFFANDQAYYGVNFTAQRTLASVQDFLSVNAQGSATFSFNYSNDLGTSLFAQVPVYITGRVGALSTKFSESIVGFGLGVGGTFTYANIPFAFDDGGVIVTDRLRQAWLSPAVMADLTLQILGRTYTLRGHANLLPQQGKDRDPFTNEPLEFSNLGVGLIFGI